MSDPKPGTDLTNPKDLVGQAKVDLSLFPPAAHIHGAHAFMDGAVKYGAYNWRERQVRARVYISAAQRHLADFLDGEDVAQDSGVHHLGHVIACCGIILDALETGNLIDDRPVVGAASAILDRLNAGILARRDARTITLPASVAVGKTEAAMTRLSAAVFADEADSFPGATVGADVQADRVVFQPAFHPCKCDPSGSTRCIFTDCEGPVPEPVPYLSPAEAEAVAELRHEPDCACAPGVRCHATFKTDCPRLVERREAGKPGCQDTGTKLSLCHCQKHPGAACNGAHPWCLEPPEGGR